MRDSIVKVRMTAQEKANLFDYSERNCATVSDLLRGASRDICAQQSISRDTRKSLVALRRQLNAVLDAPTEGSIAAAKRAISQVLGRLQ